MFRWMKDHLELCAIIATALLVAALSASYFVAKIHKLKQDNQRLEQNQQSLLAEVDTLTLDNGKHLLRVHQLELNKHELEQVYHQQEQELKELGIKAKRLQMLLNTASQTNVSMDVQLHDSVISVPSKIDGGSLEYNDSPVLKLDTIKAWHWQDNWVQAHGMINNQGLMHATFTSSDSLLIVAHRVPKRFLFFKVGTKYVELDIKSSNPHTKLTYARMVQLTTK